ncbi:hypothetical protein [Thalassoglobus polymorphus]|uniref:Uncharacterized protein n=1 Tax=Thalassoglobus polymorphus TaxID=2527994 RepID=A0A517QUF3_9PLAN|nr:hypothetical protein [Thalassoglobus polymorphus]QDT35269.1 hypothetical protein Mal48_45450 [Thalassoglobus polymorphus]
MDVQFGQGVLVYNGLRATVSASRASAVATFYDTETSSNSDHSALHGLAQALHERFIIIRAPGILYAYLSYSM